jgi:glutamate dehydrogenase/leucine dehydrogenase
LSYPDTSETTLISLLEISVPVGEKSVTCSEPTRSTETSLPVSSLERVETGEVHLSDPKLPGVFILALCASILTRSRYGLVYYVTEMMKDLDNTDWKGKKVLISGAGNVAQYAALKVLELGGTVLSLSDSNGSLVATGSEGFTAEDIAAIADIKLARKSMTAFDAGSKFKWHEGARPWTLVEKADVALPSATQNEVSEDEAKALIKAGVRYVAEGSNMSVRLSDQADDIADEGIGDVPPRL